MLSNLSNKASNAEVDAWLTTQLSALAELYSSYSNEYRSALTQIHTEQLSAGRNREYRFADMAATERYSLPPTARRTIIAFQREHDFLEPRRGGKVPYTSLFDILHLSDSTSTALPQFLKLCRRKVDAFVKNNGITWRKIGAVQKTSDGLHWESWTNIWLSPDWDGTIDPPFCQHCGHRPKEALEVKENSQEIASVHYESLRSMIVGIGESIKELSAKFQQPEEAPRPFGDPLETKKHVLQYEGLHSGSSYPETKRRKFK